MLVDDFRRIKEVLLVQGWHQGSLCPDAWDANHGNNIQPVCLMGAVNLALHGKIYPSCIDLDIPYRQKIVNVFHQHIGDSVAAWNDSNKRTFDDVIALLDRIICDLSSNSNQKDTNISSTESNIPALLPS